MEKKKKVMKILREVASRPTDWSWLADVFVLWMLQHPESETFKDFVDFLDEKYLDEEDPEVWGFFFGYGHDEIERFILDWVDAEDEESFRAFVERQKNFLKEV